MYDLKNQDSIAKDNPSSDDKQKVDISDRGYFKEHLSANVLSTKCSCVPCDDLL
ncbi:hypothetical protein [Inconstantimicrobium mannanitabidum]|uniref:Uncharacterized protein n=1 Tax=Inconstantimicrobium mannanitabidum TaxID=1604901 RepID=A0ACB5RBX1_9CLOT|nr:hypothetical protein [Clostridium sp. TW13]GKX66575.1 hypothetical protein rsdtw13_18330 [Clostridium sp. TW13]